jgi:hypothetical protein
LIGNRYRFLVLLIVAGCAWYLSANGLPDISQPAPEAAEPLPTDEPGTSGNTGEFDYYSLALSWSPEYCNSEWNERSAAMQWGEDSVLHYTACARIYQGLSKRLLIGQADEPSQGTIPKFIP